MFAALLAIYSLVFSWFWLAESNHVNVVLPCRSAQFEHTVVITSDGVDILTRLPEEECVS